MLSLSQSSIKMASRLILPEKCNIKSWRYSPLGRELGRGTYGVTRLVTDITTAETFACKTICKERLQTTDLEEEDMRHEVAVMQHLPEHPNIVALRGVYEDDVDVRLVMELCEGGELYDRYAHRLDTGNPYSEKEAIVLIRAIMKAVQTCHEHGVMHRDLKLENCMFVNKNEDSPLKVIDFGLSMFFKPGEKYSEIKGSHLYVAPEMWLEEYGPEVDVWSAGVILYMLLSGRAPFGGRTNEEFIDEVVYGDYLDLEADPWPKVSKKAKSLVQYMLERDPTVRYTTQQVLDHVWLHLDRS